MAKLYQVLTAEYHSAIKRDELSGGSGCKVSGMLLVHEVELNILPRARCAAERRVRDS